MSTYESPSNTAPHHVQQNLCTNRPLYRQGKKLTAVKVYTVASESQHIFIYGVPKINLRNELKTLCTKYGQLNKIHVVENAENEVFTECYHASYQRIQSARIAKRVLDNKSFYGGILHVCYTPEYESIEELKCKLEHRRYDVLKRLHGDQVPRPNYKDMMTGLPPGSSNCIREVSRKRKRPAVALTEKRMSEVDPMIAWKDVPKDLDPRIKSSGHGETIPKKHYQMDDGQINEQEVKKVRVPIMTRNVYGPQLPTDIILNYGDETKESSTTNNDKLSANKVLIPTQVVLSKEFIYKNVVTNDKKQIVFKKTDRID